MTSAMSDRQPLDDGPAHPTGSAGHDCYTDGDFPAWKRTLMDNESI
jgi:hypothetical protein